MGKVFINILSNIVLLAVITGAAGCSIRSVFGSVSLPDSISGLKLEMSKDEVRKVLSEKGELVQELEKNQQLWQLKNNPQFSQMVVGFNKENKVRFITAFVEKGKVTERIRFNEVGTLSEAKSEILPPHYRYTWEAPASRAEAPYFVTIYGDNPDFVTMYSIFTKSSSGEEEEEGEID